MPAQGMQSRAARTTADRPEADRPEADRPEADRPEQADRPQAGPADAAYRQAAYTPATRAAAAWLSRQLTRPAFRPLSEPTAATATVAERITDRSIVSPAETHVADSAPDPAASVGGQPRIVSSGFRSVDRLLPAGGLRRGGIVEWIADGDAAGAMTLAAALACRLVGASPAVDPVSRAATRPASQPGTIVVVDRGARFHPPAVLPWLAAAAAGAVRGNGVMRPQLVVARPARDEDELWTIDQSLRCPGVAAVLAWPRRVHATALRRWQLAARASGAAAMLVRVDAGAVEAVRREPTWADARVIVSPQITAAPRLAEVGDDPGVRRLRLTLVGGPWAGEALLEEPSTELLLDVARGVEVTGPGPERNDRRCGGGEAAGGFSCRAS